MPAASDDGHRHDRQPATMLRVDFVAPAWLACGMDEETADFVIELATHAGCLMEDASMLALTLSSIAPEDRTEVLRRLVVVAGQIRWLLGGALLLQLA